MFWPMTALTHTATVPHKVTAVTQLPGPRIAHNTAFRDVDVGDAVAVHPRTDMSDIWRRHGRDVHCEHPHDYDSSDDTVMHDVRIISKQRQLDSIHGVAMFYHAYVLTTGDIVNLRSEVTTVIRE